MTIGYKYRITVLTSRLIRMEYQENSQFVDEPTQVVVNRNFPRVEYTTFHENGHLIIETDHMVFDYDGQAFSPEGLSIKLKENGQVWHYSVVYGNSDRNYFGTARTLDGADGGVYLDSGLFGEYGYAVVDDSKSALLVDGEYVPRVNKGKDIYFFGYNKDFREGLRDFYNLCGRVPMVPRYVLGNWWSRYYPYSESSYNELLDKMEQENIPISVAVIDMDWHLTDVDPKYGTGWTGYTWNPDLFPDYKRFLKGLKDRGLGVTLNLHPADGIRAFEKQYEAVCKRVGADSKEEKAVEFNFADKNFREAYFKDVMHPYENDGVDFWWIDWQQGEADEKNPVDPLFLLNHYHYMDMKNGHKRPMIFSRYAGVGSHRYPIGFSGDTVSTWKSLKFQPYFTATASNIGYGWWSHDIGGHMMGDKNEERLIRWIQFGVFSPIMRLHSSASPFFNKEPWNVSEPYRSVMGEFMRLRHQLIPYIYTMSHKTYTEGQMLIEPMYYRLPDEKAAYECGNEYFFGDNLLVGAITEETDAITRLAKINMLIPDGKWYDIFTGNVYTGGRKNLYRTVDSIPVLLPEGGIVPLSMDEGNSTANPTKLRLLIGAGKSGEFTLYEDDGITNNYENGDCVTTKFTVEFDENSRTTRVKIHGAEGNLALLPSKRIYEFVIYGLEGKECEKFETPELPVQEQYIYEVTAPLKKENDYVKNAFKILDNAWMDNLQKEHIYDIIKNVSDRGEAMISLASADIDLKIKDAIMELL